MDKYLIKRSSKGKASANLPAKRSKSTTSTDTVRDLSHSEPTTSKLGSDESAHNTQQPTTSKSLDKPNNKPLQIRKWQDSWNRDFDFLISNQEKTIVYCKICRSVYGPLAVVTLPHMYDKYRKGALVMGCKSMKRETWVEHGKSMGHRAALSFNTAQTKPKEMPAPKMIMAMNTDQIKQISYLFRNAHAVAKKCRPFSDYIWQNTLDEKKDLKTYSSYRSDKSCREFIKVLAKVEQNKISSEIIRAPFISALSDGSTDLSAIENEIVYAKFAVEGLIHFNFINLVSVQKADAKGVYAAIKKGLNSLEVDLEMLLNKLVAFGADGASVNTGEQNGVIALMREELGEYILIIKCLAHRLELAFKDALRKSKLHMKIESLLSNLYANYKNYLQRANLKATYTAINQSPVMPTRVGGTRWLGHTELALKKMLQGYPAFVLQLEQAQSSVPKAKAILKMLKSKSVILFAHLLLDICSILASLSAQLQTKELHLYQAVNKVKQSITLLEKLKDSSGSMLKVMETDGEYHNAYKGTILVGPTDDFKVQRITVLQGLVDAMEKRYADVAADSSFLSSTTLADFRTWPPNIEEEQTKDFGDVKVERLIQHFGPVIVKSNIKMDKSQMLAEWIGLKIALYSSHSNIEALTWSRVNQSYKTEFPNILSLIDLLLTLPSSTAECERGFSAMKRVKTTFRNRLNATTISDLLTIHLMSPAIEEFDPTEAISLWNSGSIKRRMRKRMVIDPITGEAVLNQVPSGEVDDMDDQGAAAATVTADADSDYDSCLSDSSSSDINMNLSDTDVD